MKIACTFACLISILTLAGCGPDRPDTAPVSGRITFNGQPVTTGTITFYPDEGRSSLGKIQADGTYTLTTFVEGDGALPDNHTVTIKSTQVSGGAMPESFDAEVAMASSTTPASASASAVTWLVPEEYSNRKTSGLTATVEDKKNEINFDLPK